MYGKNSIDPNYLRSVFGSAQTYKPPIQARTNQVAAVTPANETLIDLDYWDFDELAAKDYDAFDWLITKQVAATTNDNFLLSPLGLKLALAILSEAATGPTQDEIVSVLGFDLDRAEARRKFSKIIESLKVESPEYILNLGSRVYVRNNAVIRQHYAAIAESFYKTEMKTIDFFNPEVASSEINAWVNKVTQGRIPNLVTPNDVSGLVVMILNTLYFRGSWRHQFPTNQTKNQLFYVSPGLQKQLPFMHVTDKFFYADSTKYDAKILRMPYRGNKFAMYIILPNSITGISRIMPLLSNLRDELLLVNEYLVDVSLPKFKFEYTSHLESILRILGIRTAFEDTASFPGIARGQKIEDRLKVSRVIQKSGIDVNELGSIAYSATEIGIENKFGEGTETPVEFFANKPFLFFIQDDSTRQLLFTGRVSDPTLDDGVLKN